MGFRANVRACFAVVFFSQTLRGLSVDMEPSGPSDASGCAQGSVCDTRGVAFSAPTEAYGNRMNSNSLLQSNFQTAWLGDKETSGTGHLPPLVMKALDDVASKSRDKLVLGTYAQPSNYEDHDYADSVFDAVVISLPLGAALLSHGQAGDDWVDDDKNIVGLSALPELDKKCVVYGIGIASSSRFEEKIGRLGCEVHAFDCTVKPDAPVVSGKNKQFTFHPWCIGEKKDTIAKNSYHLDDARDSSFLSLKKIMARLNHSYVDLLKFDIEGYEWDLFESELLKSTNPPEQLAFELHTRAANPDWVPPENVAGKGYKQVNELFLKLHDIGYRVASKEINKFDRACAEFVLLYVNPRQP